MATPFARTIRSIQADSATPSLVALAVATLLLLLWLGWFFLGRMTLYEFSRTIEVQSDAVVIADVAATARDRINYGQAAFVHLEGTAGREMGAIPAVVIDIRPQPDPTKVRVYLQTDWRSDAPVAPQPTLTGWAEIETENVSPAVLLMRTVGQFVDTPQVQTSPQQSSGQTR